MRRTFLYVVLLFLFFLGNADSSSVTDDIQSISSLIDSGDLLKARELAQSLRSRYDQNDHMWLVQSNILLGSINKEEGDFGKAIIYYLESIRYGEKANYENVTKDLALSHNWCGIIFKRFKANDLAKRYFLKGIEHAKANNNQVLELSLNYNLAGLYRDEQNYEAAINLLQTYLPQTEFESKRYFNFNNRLALTLREAGQYYQAIEIHSKIKDEVSESYPERMGLYTHNLAKTYRVMGDFKRAQDHYLEAINLKSLHNDKKSLFSSYFGYGQTHFELNDLNGAEMYLVMAEKLLESQPQHPDYFDLHKSLANVHFELGNYQKSKHYEDLYARDLNEYLQLQREIQETDKSYNMDLITKRYFDEVAKQDRIASILFYSRLISGTLLFLLLANIAYHRFQKVNLRKSIERELIALKIVD